MLLVDRRRARATALSHGCMNQPSQFDVASLRVVAVLPVQTLGQQPADADPGQPSEGKPRSIRSIAVFEHQVFLILETRGMKARSSLFRLVSACRSVEDSRQTHFPPPVWSC